MTGISRAVVLGMLAIGQVASGQSETPGLLAPSVKSGTSAANLADVPALPRGKSTIMGGKIGKIDQVRDQFVLSVYGEKPMKIWFDERTQVFRDGVKISLLQLGPADHASVETNLDGARIFAVSVHILSTIPGGDFEGRIADYDPRSGELTLVGDRLQGQFRVRVTANTRVSRTGQASFIAEDGGQRDLMPGALVSLSFQPDGSGKGIAQQITVQATPGATFLFTGTISSLNAAGGFLVVLDPTDQRSHQIYFNPHDPNVETLHAGDNVRIDARYDGAKYAATQIVKP